MSSVYVKRSDAVSCVMSTYNRNELLLKRSLPSVLSQSYPIAEIHIVADGMAQPEMYELTTALAALDRPEIRLWWIQRQAYPEDPGQRWMVLGLNARNYALDQAQGGWIAPLDDDDEWTPDHVERLLGAVRDQNADFAYGQSVYHWPDGHPQMAGSWPPGMGAFCDGAQLYRNGLGYRYDPTCVARGLPEDGDLWTRMVAGGVRFTFLPEIVHHYWVNPR